MSNNRKSSRRLPLDREPSDDEKERRNNRGRKNDGKRR